MNSTSAGDFSGETPVFEASRVLLGIPGAPG
jgi:hypothetical protein